MDKWLQYLLQGRDGAEESTVISIHRLPYKTCPKIDTFEIASFAMQKCDMQLSSKTYQQGSGG